MIKISVWARTGSTGDTRQNSLEGTVRSIKGWKLSHSPAMTAHREHCSTKDPAQSPGTTEPLPPLVRTHPAAAVGGPCQKMRRVSHGRHALFSQRQ